MEPPTPTHIFSEAAVQTPAPLPMVATPPPPPLPMTTANPIPAAPTTPKPGPPSRPSFAEATAKTLCPNTPPLHVTLPLSQPFIKIVDIPYFKPSTTEPPNGQEIGDQLISSPISINMIKHAQFIHNSPKADSRTFWIDLIDSQQGTLTSSLIG
ncbi:hypothetical protein P691DRAFT_765500 [Macrolepiota fuliginosa MF-IS2]|uniref:Uncharacterized protein n=1 Tax=Macrolepiota fuliginosa MF-IS2 TaxID=1400762 RepID=A0A9P5X2D8_9AGAR|nr:hypothetical protein P691DRAFT_765500 [Macrolepiota fuliginosa MF-IS2]